MEYTSIRVTKSFKEKLSKLKIKTKSYENFIEEFIPESLRKETIDLIADQVVEEAKKQIVIQCFKCECDLSQGICTCMRHQRDEQHLHAVKTFNAGDRHFFSWMLDDIGIRHGGNQPKIDRESPPSNNISDQEIKSFFSRNSADYLCENGKSHDWKSVGRGMAYYRCDKLVG